MKQFIDLMGQFHTPLSAIVFQQPRALIPAVQQLGNATDEWTYVLNTDQFYVNNVQTNDGTIIGKPFVQITMESSKQNQA